MLPSIIQEEATLNDETTASKQFAIGDRSAARRGLPEREPMLGTWAEFGTPRGVVARDMLADVAPGQGGTVVEVDKDGDIKAPGQSSRMVLGWL